MYVVRCSLSLVSIAATFAVRSSEGSERALEYVLKRAIVNLAPRPAALLALVGMLRPGQRLGKARLGRFAWSEAIEILRNGSGCSG